MMVEVKQTTGTRAGARRTAARSGTGDATSICSWRRITRSSVLRGDSLRRGWRIEEPHFLGHETNHLTTDPRDGTTWLLAAKTGHIGSDRLPLHRWREKLDRGTAPTGISQSAEGKDGPALDRVFCLAPGHASQPGVWWAGSVPHALFPLGGSQRGSGSWSSGSATTWTGFAGRSRPASSQPRAEPSRIRSWWTHATPTICTSLSRRGDASRLPIPARVGAH